MSSKNTPENEQSAPALHSTSFSPQADPPTRPDPVVMLIDPETLSFSRVWTAIGAEFTYGNLNFSQDHDPFANIVLPQDITQSAAGRVSDGEDEDTSGATTTSNPQGTR
ncbi:hypothetical protein LIER_39907 [Lithospermum erythrorhizon]|uniref:Uncharacterized protein n=1 Tax=Lithospermum erythrorhizon TaxID=34254 RepID=A0AAV3QQE1_LITER